MTFAYILKIENATNEVTIRTPLSVGETLKVGDITYFIKSIEHELESQRFDRSITHSVKTFVTLE